MKKTTLTLCLSIAMIFAMAQSKKYVKTMESTINQMYQANTPEQFDAATNKFERVGQAEKDQWEAYYYASLSETFKALRNQDNSEKDTQLDKALTTLKEADAIAPNNSEVIALRGFINMIKISVDPATRGQTLSPGAMADFGKAMGMDPNNPRPVLFMGQMQFGTAQFFGTGVEEPCGMVEKSIALFESASPESSLAPMWGKQQALQYRAQCESKLSSAGN